MHVSWLSRGSLPKSWACKAHRVAGKVFSSFPFLAAFVRPRVGPGRLLKFQAVFFCRVEGAEKLPWRQRFTRTHARGPL